MKLVRSLTTLLTAIAITACSFVVPAGAVNPRLADPQTMLAAASEKTGVPATIADMLEANIITNAEKRLIEKNRLITRAVAWRVLFPVYGIYPYPAELYPDIKPANQCVDDYANARCAAITLGLTTAKQNPIQVMTAAELNALILALEKGVELPEIKTDIPYLKDIEWDRTTYEGRNSLISGYSCIPEAWWKEFDAKGWSFKFELPAPSESHVKIEGLSTAGSTSYSEKVIHIGRSQPKVAVHEMVHFIVKEANISQKQMDIVYKAERRAMKDILGVYSQTKASEYVPEFTAHWLLHADQQDAIRDIAPLSAKLAETLAAWH